MGYIIYDNKIDDTVTTSVAVSSGSITDVTNQNKLLTRSVSDSYQYTKTGLGSLTITLNFSSSVNNNAVSVLNNSNTGLTILSIKLLNSSVDQGAPTPTAITNARFIDGIYSKDEHYIFDNYYTYDEIQIKYSDVSGYDRSFGAIYSGFAYEIDFSASGVSYNPNDTSEKDYSNGRQAYVSSGVMYNALKINSAKLSHSQAWNSGGNSVNDINLVAGKDKPIIIIPSENIQNISIYGTQKNLAILSPVLKKDGDAWYWLAKFNIEEEL